MSLDAGVEIEVTDGTRRVFPAGTVMLAEDTWGKVRKHRQALFVKLENNLQACYWLGKARRLLFLGKSGTAVHTKKSVCVSLPAYGFPSIGTSSIDASMTAGQHVCDLFGRRENVVSRHPFIP